MAEARVNQKLSIAALTILVSTVIAVAPAKALFGLFEPPPPTAEAKYHGTACAPDGVEIIVRNNASRPLHSYEVKVTFFAGGRSSPALEYTITRDYIVAPGNSRTECLALTPSDVARLIIHTNSQLDYMQLTAKYGTLRAYTGREFMNDATFETVVTATQFGN